MLIFSAPRLNGDDVAIPVIYLWEDIFDARKNSNVGLGPMFEKLPDSSLRSPRNKQVSCPSGRINKLLLFFSTSQYPLSIIYRSILIPIIVVGTKDDTGTGYNRIGVISARNYWTKSNRRIPLRRLRVWKGSLRRINQILFSFTKSIMSSWVECLRWAYGGFKNGLVSLFPWLRMQNPIPFTHTRITYESGCNYNKKKIKETDSIEYRLFIRFRFKMRKFVQQLTNF